jgi:hypothetical protein
MHPHRAKQHARLHLGAGQSAVDFHAVMLSLQEDICAVFPPNSPYRSYTEQWLTATLEKLLLNGFQLDNSAEEFDQANLEDAQLDEALQNAANCGGLSSSAPTAFLPGGEGLDEVNQQQPQVTNWILWIILQFFSQ